MAKASTPTATVQTITVPELIKKMETEFEQLVANNAFAKKGRGKRVSEERMKELLVGLNCLALADHKSRIAITPNEFFTIYFTVEEEG